MIYPFTQGVYCPQITSINIQIGIATKYYLEIPNTTNMSDKVAAEKARYLYCAKCKDFVEASRFGQQQNKRSKSAICNQHAEETPEVTRFCCECKDHLPVAEFHKGQRRFMCKKHMALQNVAKCRENRINIPGKLFSERTWNRCWRDSKRFFTTKMDLKVNDILHIWNKADPLAQKNLILLPIDPTIDINNNNVIIVNKKTRKALLKLISNSDLERYKRKVRALLTKSKDSP